MLGLYTTSPKSSGTFVTASEAPCLKHEILCTLATKLLTTGVIIPMFQEKSNPLKQCLQTYEVPWLLLFLEWIYVGTGFFECKEYVRGTHSTTVCFAQTQDFQA